MASLMKIGAAAGILVAGEALLLTQVGATCFAYGQKMGRQFCEWTEQISDRIQLLIQQPTEK